MLYELDIANCRNQRPYSRSEIILTFSCLMHISVVAVHRACYSRLSLSLSTAQEVS